MAKCGTIIGIALILAVSLSSVQAYASCGYCKASSHSSAKTDKAEKEPVNRTCPVMGGKVSKDTPYKTVYKGKTIGFCCAGCVEAFNADPKKYYKNLK
jgi:YHS domain-containing protein